MKGLLLKDLYMMIKYCKYPFFISVLFIAFSLVGTNNSFFMFPCIICGMIPMNILGYDEKSRWEQYSGTLPYTKAQIVSSKYLMALLIQLAVMLITVTSHGIKMGLNGEFQFNDLAVIMLINIVAFTLPSICLPFIFKFGAENGRLAFTIMMFVWFAVVAVLSFGVTELPEADLSIEFKPLEFLSIACLIAAAAYAISWLLSIAFYKRRELG